MFKQVSLNRTMAGEQAPATSHASDGKESPRRYGVGTTLAAGRNWQPWIGGTGPPVQQTIYHRHVDASACMPELGNARSKRTSTNNSTRFSALAAQRNSN